MCCFVLALVFAAPRLCLFFMWLFSGYIGRAYDSFIWPVLGFFFMPYTTLAYAVAWNEGGGLNGFWMAVFIFGILMDAGAFGWLNQNRKRRDPPLGGAAHEIDHGG
ncbi:MAG TPA: hypothetical protein VEJ63_12950 [Planctomycetota bacterium]|nr:hypothetical protein [Planctomycetota bacterium]